jgi:hypothetical protein
LKQAETLDKKTIKRVERQLEKTKSKLFTEVSRLYATVLHEGVHKGDFDANGKFSENDYNPNKQGTSSTARGYDFEEDYFGGYIEDAKDARDFILGGKAKLGDTEEQVTKDVIGDKP